MTTPPTALARRAPRCAGLVVVVILALLIGAGCQEAAFSSAIAVNDTRSSVGRSTLTLEADLSAVAQRHAEAMARSRRLYHSYSSSRPPAGYRTVGENVGRGHTVSGIHGALRASPGHYSNMVNPSFSAFGVGSAYGSDGKLYVTQLFAG